MIAISGSFWLFSFLYFVVWVALAFWPARVAGWKGHSFFGFFLFSLVFFPAALIVAYVVQDKNATRAYQPLISHRPRW